MATIPRVNGMQTPPASLLERRLIAVLETFEGGVPGVLGSAVADREGLPIASGIRDPGDLAAVTAMGTLALHASRRVFDRLRLGPPASVIIEGEAGKVVVSGLGEGRANFIAVVQPDANVGLLKLEMAVARRKLEEELGFAPVTGARIEEVFLLTQSGLLIAHASLAADSAFDQDVVAGMFTAVQAFVKDVFRANGGGALEEMELAHCRVRLLRAASCTVAIIASGRVSDAYLSAARAALRLFEERNKEALGTWDGDPDTLEGVAELLDELQHHPTGAALLP
jgi:predicted regulator of Ras-like GTPase activity (Roadblock/LC7/MglB family)